MNFKNKLIKLLLKIGIVKTVPVFKYCKNCNERLSEWFITQLTDYTLIKLGHDIEYKMICYNCEKISEFEQHDKKLRFLKWNLKNEY